MDTRRLRPQKQKQIRDEDDTIRRPWQDPRIPRNHTGFVDLVTDNVSSSSSTRTTYLIQSKNFRHSWYLSREKVVLNDVLERVSSMSHIHSRKANKTSRK